MMLPYEAAKALGIRLQGHLMTCPHPEHADKRPSCLVRPGDRKWKCFSCGKIGDAVDLAIYVGGMTLADARAWAQYERPSGPVPEPVCPKLSPEAQAWCESIPRRVDYPSDALARWCESRGLDPMLAVALGWRDCAMPIESAPKELGYRREDGRLLWGLDKPGVWVPVYVPGYTRPVLWRRRLFFPPVIEGRKIKVIAPSSVFSSWGWGVSGFVRTGEAHIVEGEPDWLAYAKLHPGERILARFGSVQVRKETLSAFAPGVAVVTVATHINAGSDRMIKILGGLGFSVVDRRVPESRDWADRAKDGESTHEPGLGGSEP